MAILCWAAKNSLRGTLLIFTLCLTIFQEKDLVIALLRTGLIYSSTRKRQRTYSWSRLAGRRFIDAVVYLPIRFQNVQWRHLHNSPPRLVTLLHGLTGWDGAGGVRTGRRWWPWPGRPCHSITGTNSNPINRYLQRYGSIFPTLNLYIRKNESLQSIVSVCEWELCLAQATIYNI